MTPEIAMYALGCALLPLIGWGVQITWNVNRVREETLVIRAMLEEPEKHGFGTTATNLALSETHNETVQCIRANTQAIYSLTHYIKWLAVHQTGSVPEPPVTPPDALTGE